MQGRASRPLSLENAHPKDARIRFRDAGHKYSVKFDDKEPFREDRIISVTELIGRQFKPFEVRKYGAKLRRNWLERRVFGCFIHDLIDNHLEHGKDPLQYTPSPQQVIDWGTSKDKSEKSFFGEGPKAVAKASDWVTAQQLNREKTIRQFYRFQDDFIRRFSRENSAQLVPYRSEWRIWTPADTRVTGTADAVYALDYGEAQAFRDYLEVVLFDWKIQDAEGKNGLTTLPNPKKRRGRPQNWRYVNRNAPFVGVLSDLPGSFKYFKQTLQLAVYTYILEHFYSDVTFRGRKYKGIRVHSAWVVCMHPQSSTLDKEDEPTYFALSAPRNEELITKVFEERAEELRRVRANGIEVKRTASLGATLASSAKPSRLFFEDRKPADMMDELERIAAGLCPACGKKDCDPQMCFLWGK